MRKARKTWKVVALAGVAMVTAQFGFIGALHAQTTGGATTGGATTTGRTTGVTTTGGGVPTPIPVQPRFTG